MTGWSPDLVLLVMSATLDTMPPLPEEDAVMLFGLRARALDPGFELTDVKDDVSEICRRVDARVRSVRSCPSMRTRP